MTHPGRTATPYRDTSLEAPRSWALDAARRLAWVAILSRGVALIGERFAQMMTVSSLLAHTATFASMILCGAAGLQLWRAATASRVRLAAALSLLSVVGFVLCSARVAWFSSSVHAMVMPVWGFADRLFLETVSAATAMSLVAPLALAAALARRPSDSAPVAEEPDATATLLARAAALRSFATGATGIVLSMVGSIALALALEHNGARFQETAAVRGAGLVSAALFVALSVRASRRLQGWTPASFFATAAYALWVLALSSAVVTLRVWVEVVRVAGQRSLVIGAWASQAIVEGLVIFALAATAIAATTIASRSKIGPSWVTLSIPGLALLALAGALAWVHVEMPDFIMRTEAQRSAVYATMALAVFAVLAVAGVARAVAKGLGEKSSRAAKDGG
jgi:hypothetical protein